MTGITVKQVTRIVAPFMDERPPETGPVCPACGDTRKKHRIGQVNDRQRLKCLSCGRRFCPSATSGTNTALPPETVSSVVAKYHAFMPRKEIAVRCGLTVKAVSEILKPYRHTRIHVMCPPLLWVEDIPVGKSEWRLAEVSLQGMRPRFQPEPGSPYVRIHSK
ncbi:hypothetical protein LNP56_27330 [Klebsiella pneumoniae subsp. pneumoniae]|nr:hypothetical protein [Klebsiella pneumoniae subsp. pneumoniae]